MAKKFIAELFLKLGLKGSVHSERIERKQNQCRAFNNVSNIIKCNCKNTGLHLIATQYRASIMTKTQDDHLTRIFNLSNFNWNGTGKVLSPE